jgi:hypothetical protein
MWPRYATPSPIFFFFCVFLSAVFSSFLLFLCIFCSFSSFFLFFIFFCFLFFPLFNDFTVLLCYFVLFDALLMHFCPFFLFDLGHFSAQRPDVYLDVYLLFHELHADDYATDMALPAPPAYDPVSRRLLPLARLYIPHPHSPPPTSPTLALQVRGPARPVSGHVRRHGLQQRRRRRPLPAHRLQPPQSRQVGSVISGRGRGPVRLLLFCQICFRFFDRVEI